ncbi:MAG: hypothetical protein IPK80_35305 [Nannocystis sp.]|nr:hypothetical protein [Nannocystis sp.]
MTTTMPSTTTTSTSESTGVSDSATMGSTTAVDPERGSECGDGVLDPGESCDDGAKNGPGQPCSATCARRIAAATGTRAQVRSVMTARSTAQGARARRIVRTMSAATATRGQVRAVMTATATTTTPARTLAS